MNELLKYDSNSRSVKVARKVLLIFALSFAFLNAYTQDSLQLQFELDNVKRISIDPLNNFYVINIENELIKYDDGYKFVAAYRDNFFSEETNVASGNPFKTIIYHPAYGNIITLDNKLSEISNRNYYDLGLNDISAVASSNDYQSIWLFDPIQQKLVKLNQQYELALESEELINIIDAAVFPISLQAFQDWVYLYDPQKGICLFDNAANYSKTIPLKGVKNLRMNNGWAYFLSDNKIERLNITTFEREILQFNERISSFYIQNNLLAIVDLQKKLKVYKLP